MKLGSFKRLAPVVAVLFLAAASSFAKEGRRLTINHQASVGSATLAAGNYAVSWSSPTGDPTVTFFNGKHTVASVQAKWVNEGERYSQNAVVYGNNPDGTRTILEVRFKGLSQALVLGGNSAS